MSTTLADVASYPGLINALDTFAVMSLLFISGLSFCLSVWVIPNMYLVPPHLQLQQFTATFEKGAKYLMPGGRLIMAILVTRTLLAAVHPDESVSRGSSTWAAISGMMLLAAPYEIYFIFPINDRAKELKMQVEKDKEPLTRRQEGEVSRLITDWATRNYGRVLLPLLAGISILLSRWSSC